jgi:hypothetical protein
MRAPFVVQVVLLL